MHIPRRTSHFFLSFFLVLSFLISQNVFSQSKVADEVRPQTLTYMNRDLATFRGYLNGASPAVRVDNALKRINQVEVVELTEDVRAVPFTLAGEKGFQFHLGNRHLFSIIEKDLK